MNNPEQFWLRWWDLEGNLLLIGQRYGNPKNLVITGKSLPQTLNSFSV